MGIFISIEGTDGSGKATQQKLLVKHLKENKKRIVFVDFPEYKKTLFGDIAGKMLVGKYGHYETIDPHFKALVFALGRFQAKEKIENALKTSIVVSNRYTLSNMAHQASYLPKSKRSEFIKFVEELEYKILQIPKPDIYIYLSVSSNSAQKLIMGKGKRKYLGKDKKRDQAEENINHQIESRKMYESFVGKIPNVFKVDCQDKKGNLLKEEEIHNKVWNIVEKYLVK